MAAPAPMFGCIVAGRLVQTNCQQVDETHFVFELERPEEINHIVVFLTGAVAFPEGVTQPDAEGFSGAWGAEDGPGLLQYASTVHFLWPGSEKGWQLLGKLSNDKPSSIFRLRGSITPSSLSTRSSSTLTSIANATPQSAATLGISIEPVQLVEQQVALMAPQTSAVDVTKKGLDDPTVLASKILKNLFQYISGFAQGNVGPQTAVPLGVIQQWYNKFTAKIQNAGIAFLENED